MRKIISITKDTLIPVGSFVAIVSIITACTFFLAGMAMKVEAQDKKDSPSRTEFNSLCGDVKDIKEGVDKINEYLLKNKLEK
jgi:hypothetical protein